MPMEIKDKIKLHRSKLNMTQDDIAKKIGVTKQTIFKYENGIITNIPLDKIELLAQVFGVTPLELTGWESEESQNQQKSSSKIPVLGSVPAGTPIEAVEDIVDWEEIPASMTTGKREYFALLVKGNSMYPRYEEGDVVIVRKQNIYDPAHPDSVVIVNSNDATFKRVQYNGSQMILRPLNPEYDMMVFSEKDVDELPVTILGVVVELRRKV